MGEGVFEQALICQKKGFCQTMNKMNLKQISGLIISISGVLIIIPQSAYAYLDPGTGSYVLQILIATVFGAWFSIKIFGKRLKAFLRNLFSKDQEK